MQWIPTQYGRYILSNIYIWMTRLFLTVLSIYGIIRGLHMFEHITELEITIAMCAVAVVCWVGLIQYSKYQKHIKDNLNASEAKLAQAREFSFIPYLVLPLLAGCLAVFIGLWVADFAVVKGYIAGNEEIVAIAIIASIVTDCILAKYLVNHVGDALYFQTVEDKVAEIVEEFPEIDAEDMKLLAVLKQLKK